MTTKHLILLARYSFGISFMIGTILIIMLFTYPFDYRYELPFLYFGIFYIFIAFLYNSITFLFIIIMGLIRKKDRKEIILNACIMLLNIPISYTYVIITIHQF